MDQKLIMMFKGFIQQLIAAFKRQFLLQPVAVCIPAGMQSIKLRMCK